jgi:hypothetical protein
MQTTVNLPDFVYEQTQALAASRGSTVEQFIVDAVRHAVEEQVSFPTTEREIELPVIRSKRPGTLDLSRFDFDDLLT